MWSDLMVTFHTPSRLLCWEYKAKVWSDSTSTKRKRKKHTQGMSGTRKGITSIFMPQRNEEAFFPQTKGDEDGEGTIHKGCSTQGTYILYRFDSPVRISSIPSVLTIPQNRATLCIPLPLYADVTYEWSRRQRPLRCC